MLLTTTDCVEGKKIVSYKGIISGEAILGANIVRDFMAGVRDIIGGRSGAYEEVLVKAKDTALQEISDRARAIGANAVVGVHLDYENLNGTMLMVVVSGTAVTVE